GGGGSAGDTRPGSAPATALTVSDPNAFLLFPNPQLQSDGSKQTDTAAYTQAYYAAIDPTSARDTLNKWKAANGFDSGTGTQVTVVFGDRRDLGYGRRMTARQNTDGTIAFYVENYLVQAGAAYAYSPLNLDAAVVRDTRWLLGINAIEYSPGPAGGASFTKFFNFNATTGQRATAVDLDGRGDKAMPGPCITCHGGRGDALTPPDASGQPRFNLVQYALSQTRGDVQARLHPFEADAFGFSATAGFTRADQEAALKVINKMILCSYPLPTPSALPEDACRRPAIESEWQGTAADFIKAAYGGDGLPNATFSDTYVPFAWTSAGQTTLYQSVIAPACRTCHMMRGTGAQSDLDFTSFAKFQSYADRTKAHVVDRGNMPLAKIVFDAYYTSNRPDVMATYLQGEGYAVRDSAGVPLRPGRPVADPGPDRVVRQGATALSAAMSLFANSYAWSLISGPNGATPATGATLSNANSAQPTFTASSDGSYVLQLVAGNGTTQSAPAQLTLVVNNALTPAPSTIRFADIKAAIQGGQCTNCHSPSGTLPRPPLFYTNYDRNGDGVVDATDDAWFYAEIRSRINFTDIVASPLLRKPSGHHHGGNAQLGFNDTLSPGSSGRSNYDLFLNWILNGAPQ
ncbi:MAG TPA: hypothetical protein VF928_13690, partial [Usitatibacteraceae bacterium]